MDERAKNINCSCALELLQSGADPEFHKRGGGGGGGGGHFYFLRKPTRSWKI